jgi:acetyl esterase/lipase
MATNVSAEPIQIWPGVAPGSEEWDVREEASTNENGLEVVSGVSVPTLTPYLPDPAKATGTAVIVAPGGAFQVLAWRHEGTDIAEWLAARGIAAFVLKYRVATPAMRERARPQWEALAARIAAGEQPGMGALAAILGEIIPLAAADGRQAVRALRERAAEFGINPGKIGFLGFSAGGHVATATALADEPEARPDFVAPIYGASVGEVVPAEAPPLFIVVAADDGLAKDSCIPVFTAWRSAGRPAELHVYERGGHGFGSNVQGLPVDSWRDRLADWMGSLGY